MKYPAYPNYKDSGVEWLGEIPADWSISKLKFLVSFSGGGTPSTDNPLYWNGQYPWVSSKDMKNEFITETELNITEEGIKNSPAKIVPAGSLLMVVRSGILKHTLPIAVNMINVTVNQDIRVIQPLKELYPSYLRHFVIGYNDQLLSILQKQGATVESIEQDLLSNCPISLPSLKTQQSIASFLDTETAKIDGLIKDYEELILLLQEKRQALISHAVTRGLSELVSPDDPEFGEWAKPVKFKDSGVEWLGEIPEEWEICKMKYLCNITTGCKDTVDAIEEGDYPFFVRSQVVERIDTYSYDCEAILTAGDGVGVGKVFHHYVGKFDFHQRVYLMHSFTDIEPRFFYHYLCALFAKVALDGGAKSTVDSLRRPVLTEFFFTITSNTEQRAITSFIDKNTSKIDSLVLETDSAISLLKEHRSALITNAVTGKINVEALV